MENTFIVKTQFKTLGNMILGLIAFFIGGTLWEILKNGRNPLALTLVTAPFIIVLLAGYLYITFTYVKVIGNIIEFRNMFGIKNKIDVSEIKRVIWRTNETKFGQNENVKVICGWKKFSVETLMNNSEKFYEYILENVSEENIIRKIRKMKSK